MRSTFKVLFYLKRNVPKKNGLVPVMWRITVNGKVSQFSSKLMWRKNHGTSNCAEYPAEVLWHRKLTGYWTRSVWVSTKPIRIFATVIIM